MKKKEGDATEILFLCHSTATNAESSAQANFYSLRHFNHLLLTVVRSSCQILYGKREVTQIYYRSYYKESQEWLIWVCLVMN